jgi:hypothetical protein
MPTDKYTKLVLTVIAACLVWICATAVGRPLNAQQGPLLASDRPQPVVIVGWGTLDSRGVVTLTMNRDRNNPVTDPRIPVNLMDAAVPLDVRLEYTEVRPLPVGLSRIKPAAEWEPIRSSVEEEPVRPKPGGRQQR